MSDYEFVTEQQIENCNGAFAFATLCRQLLKEREAFREVAIKLQEAVAELSFPPTKAILGAVDAEARRLLVKQGK